MEAESLDDKEDLEAPADEEDLEAPLVELEDGSPKEIFWEALFAACWIFSKLLAVAVST